MKVSQIAEKLGYENQAYFTRAFQSVYGMSPRDYRLEKREQQFSDERPDEKRTRMP